MSTHVMDRDNIGRNASLFPGGPRVEHGPGRLTGKVAIVTGGGSGYGEGMAKAFAAQGAKVVVADINEAAGQKVAASDKSNMTFHALDVTNEQSWKTLMDWAVDHMGKVDILVNNAGASYVNKPTLEVSSADFDKCFNVNVRSVFLSTHVFIPHLLSTKRQGVMLNISSIGATRPRPGLVWYNASKSAVSNATRALASEYGPHGIRFNAICPLLGNTGLFSTFTGMEGTEENIKNFIGNVPLGRLCTPEDVANAAVYLCSDEAAFITGQCLEVEGGKGI